MTWRLEIRPLASFPTDGNRQQVAKADFEISKALAMHRRVWRPDHEKVIQRENVEQAVRNNPGLQIGAFLVGKNPRSGKTHERLLGVVTVARFNTHRVRLQAHYDVIRQQHDPNGNAISCFIVSVKPRLPHGVNREDIDRLVQEAGTEKLVDLILKKVHEQAKELFRKRKLKYMYAWSTPADIHRNTAIAKGHAATLEQVQAHLSKENDRVIHGTHIRLGARIDGIIPNGRPNSKNLTGAGALVRMQYELK